MDSLTALIIVLAVYSIGDIVSYYTRSIVSMLFVSSVIFIGLFWLGVPTTLFADSQLQQLGGLFIGILITHMGTLLSVDDFVKQWKTVVVSALALLGIGLLLYLVGPIIIDRTYAIAAAPPISGGVVAAIIMGQRAAEMGMNEIRIFATIIVAIQGFVGYPICSAILNKEAKDILARKDDNEKDKVVETKKPLIPPLRKDLQTPYILILKLAVFSYLSGKLSALTGGIVHTFVICLFMGVLGRWLGILEESTLTKANSFGISMAAIMAVIFAPLADATPEILANLVFPLVVSLALGTLGIFIFSSIAAKLVKMSKPMAIAIGTTALFGFPGTFILSNEVANANGKTEEERKKILDEILPKMLVAGFATVTIGSVILAGVMVKML